MKIAVYGSALGGITNILREKAKEVGKEIARRGHTIVTGACPGLPHEAILGAKELGGAAIGFSPEIDLKEHQKRFKFPYKEFDEIRYIPKDFLYHDQKRACLKLRNIYSVAFSDAAIFISGRWGTLNEFSIAYDIGKPIGLTRGTGGAVNSIPALMRKFKKPSSAVVFNSDNPRYLIESLEQATTDLTAKL